MDLRSISCDFDDDYLCGYIHVETGHQDASWKRSGIANDVFMKKEIPGE